MNKFITIAHIFQENRNIILIKLYLILLIPKLYLIPPTHRSIQCIFLVNKVIYLFQLFLILFWDKNVTFCVHNFMLYKKKFLKMVLQILWFIYNIYDISDKFRDI